METPQSGGEASVVERERPSTLTDRVARHWYGWQTLLSDGLSMGAIYAGARTGAGGAASLGFLGLLLATPIVHFAHDNGDGGLSLGLRLGCTALMLVGLVAGYASDSCDGSLGLFYAGLFGFAATIVLDAAVLAFDRAPAPAAARARVMPYADARGGGLLLAYSL